MRKIGKMNEAAWMLGIILCALGVALCTKAGFGLSMIAAPTYIIHVKMTSFFSWYTQGTSEYLFQGAMLVAMCFAVRRFRLRYLLSFVTAILSGLAIDGWLFVLSGNGTYDAMACRIIAFILGELITTLAVAFFFRTRMPLQMYELFVKEIAKRYNFSVNKVKLIYDICALCLSVALALLLNKSLQGVGVGTIIITAVNAPLISLFGKILDKFFDFDPKFPKLIETLGDND